MAIVKMNKFTLLAFESEKQSLLKELQSLEGVQFINLQDDELINSKEELQGLKKDDVDSEYVEYEENLSKVRFALDFLKPYIKPQGMIQGLLSGKEEVSYEELKANIETGKWQKVYDFLKEKDNRLNVLSNEKSKLETEIETLNKWVAFDAPLKLIKEFKMAKVFMGTVSKQNEIELVESINNELKESYIEILNRDNQDLYFYIVTTKSEEENVEEIIKKFGFSSFQTTYEESPNELVNKFKEKIIAIDEEEKDITESIANHGTEINTLQMAYDYFNNLVVRKQSVNNFLRTNNVVTICGWVPTELNNNLDNAVKKTVGENYYINFEEVKEEEIEEVPIQLRNNSTIEPFEGLVEMYSLPTYAEVDPTPIISIFYFVFFGMMLSDAGYGLIMVLATAFAIWKGKDEEKKKNYKLFMYAGISTIIWGVIYGSYFGDLLSGFNIPRLLDPSVDITTIFILSLIFGIVHIFVGLGVKAYMLIKAGKIKDMIYDVVTWYVTLIGGILALLGVGGSLGMIMIAVGLIGLLLTQGRDSETFIGKLGGGVYGVYGITGYVGDVVSYSRLLALGLATGFIANALNLIMDLIPAPFNILTTPLLFVGLHTFNLLINALGSYVHAARLQYLEFFGKFYEGGGKKFSPFKLSNEYIKIKK